MKSRIILGFFIGLFGFLLMVISLFVMGSERFVSWIYGLPILVIGLFIMFNKNEDKIEKINYNGGKNKK